MTRLYQIPIDVIWQADRLADQVFALRLAGSMSRLGRKKKACFSGQRGSGGRPPFAGVGIRNSTPQPDFLQKGALG